MPFGLFDRVRIIKEKNVTGNIVDIYIGDDGQPVYTVQSDQRGYVDNPMAYNGDYPLYDCREDQITKL